VRQRFRDRNEVYQNLWKKTSKTDKCVCGPIADSTRNRIVNGEEATPHEFPWIVSMIMPDGYWFCGGTILTENYVVTASHCVEGMKPNEALIRIGDHDNDDSKDTDYHKKQTIKIKKIIMHSKYDPNSVNNDIALLKLGTKIDFKKFGGTVAPICLPESLRAYTGEKVIVAGWGLLEDGGKQPDKLRKVELEAISMQSCRNEFKYDKSWITSRMMCTFEENKDACQGDSGGPLIWRNDDRDRFELVGVVSWGIGCASKHHPGVFTKLSYFLSWILKKTGKSTYCTG